MDQRNTTRGGPPQPAWVKRHLVAGTGSTKKRKRVKSCRKKETRFKQGMKKKQIAGGKAGLECQRKRERAVGNEQEGLEVDHVKNGEKRPGDGRKIGVVVTTFRKAGQGVKSNGHLREGR